jgi:hypothetical protein
LPKDIGKAKLYIADVLHLSASELKLFFEDRELIFTCSNAINDKVKVRNEETKIDLDARKRTLKEEYEEERDICNCYCFIQDETDQGYYALAEGIEYLNQLLHELLSKMLDHA